MKEIIEPLSRYPDFLLLKGKRIHNIKQSGENILQVCLLAK